MVDKKYFKNIISNHSDNLYTESLINSLKNKRKILSKSRIANNNVLKKVKLPGYTRALITGTSKEIITSTSKEIITSTTLAGLPVGTSGPIVPINGDYGIVVGGGGNDVGEYQYIANTLDGIPLNMWLPAWFTSRKLNAGDPHGVSFEYTVANQPARIDYPTDSIAGLDVRFLRKSWNTGGNIVDTGSAFRITGLGGFGNHGWWSLLVPSPESPRIIIAEVDAIKVNGQSGVNASAAVRIQWRLGRYWGGLSWTHNGFKNRVGFSSVSTGFANLNYGSGFMDSILPFSRIICATWGGISVPPDPVTIAPESAYEYYVGPDISGQRVAMADSTDGAGKESAAYTLHITAIGGSSATAILDVRKLYVLHSGY